MMSDRRKQPVDGLEVGRLPGRQLGEEKPQPGVPRSRKRRDEHILGVQRGVALGDRHAAQQRRSAQHTADAMLHRERP